MKNMRIGLVALVACLGLLPRAARADAKARVITETAEALFARFGAKAGANVPAIASRIEAYAARYGEEAIVAARKVGPSAFGLIEAAGADGAKAVRCLAAHGEAGATRVLSRPQALNQFLRYGEEAASVLVNHPGVAEGLIERGGAQAVKALGHVTPRNGRRLAMLLEGDLAQAGRHAELLDIVARHGDSAADFIWRNKGSLAIGTGMTAFLLNPEAFINGTKDITKIVGDAAIAPITNGFATAVHIVLGTLALLLAVLMLLAINYGVPAPSEIREWWSRPPRAEPMTARNDSPTK